MLTCHSELKQPVFCHRINSWKIDIIGCLIVDILLQNVWDSVLSESHYIVQFWQW